MLIVTFAVSMHVVLKKSAGSEVIAFEAGRDYLIAQSQFDQLFKNENIRNNTLKVSNADMRCESFNVKYAKPGDTVLFFNGSGGYGDQIMTWPVVKILNDMGFNVHIVAQPGNNVCWWHFPWVKTIQTVPMPWEQTRLFDHLCLMEHVANKDEHPDQEHPVDIMLHRIGIDPKSIPNEAKCVRPLFRPEELHAARSFLTSVNRVGFYQLASSNIIRRLPATDSAFLALQLARAFPDTVWLCLYDEFVPKEYPEALFCRTCKGKGTVDAPKPASMPVSAPPPQKECSACGGTKFIAKNLQPFCAKKLRELWAMVECASVCVSPDSMLPHVAGCLGVPCVGLWGPVDPDRRVRYYKNHHAIWHHSACPQAPCFALFDTFPKVCPPSPGVRKVCDALAAVSPDEVIAAVRKIRR